MNDIIQRYLDGELPRDRLTADGLREVAAFESIASEAAEGYRSMEVPDLTARILDGLPPAGEATLPGTADRARGGVGEFLRDTLGWLWTPRPIRFRPAYGFAVAAALFVLMIRGTDASVPAGPADAATPVDAADARGVAGQLFVQFRLDAPEASSVRLAGSFTGWQPDHVLHRTGSGVWSILLPLEPGVHDYAFVVDGQEWVADPGAPAVDDGFGGSNSRLSILLPSGMSQS
jgi:hypothetical protein